MDSKAIEKNTTEVIGIFVANEWYSKSKDGT